MCLALMAMPICLGHAHTQCFPYPTLPTLPVNPQSIRVLGAAAVLVACGVWSDYTSNPNPAFFLPFPAAAAFLLLTLVLPRETEVS